MRSNAAEHANKRGARCEVARYSDDRGPIDRFGVSSLGTASELPAVPEKAIVVDAGVVEEVGSPIGESSVGASASKFETKAVSNPGSEPKVGTRSRDSAFRNSGEMIEPILTRCCLHSTQSGKYLKRKGATSFL